MGQANHIQVMHGTLCVEVPIDIFKGPHLEIDRERAAPFRDLTMKRYPWISEGAMDVILNKAQKEMMRIRDEDSNGRTYGKSLAKKGKYNQAIKHLKFRLEENPDDADTWNLLGDTLCKAGMVEEAYQAYNKAREANRSKR